MITNKIETSITEVINNKLREKMSMENSFKQWDNKIRKLQPRLVIPPLYGRGGNKSKSDRSMCKWSPPKDGWYKLNFDGASHGNPGIAGIGGIIHNWNGKMISKYARPIKPTTNNMAECKAILEGLKLCKQLGLTKVEIEGDSQIIINAIRTRKTPNQNLNSKLGDIIDILDTIPQFEIKHIYREGNTDADKLANQGASGDIV